MRKICFFILIVFLAMRSLAQAEPANYTATATMFRKFYNANLPDSIFSNFSPDFKTALPKDKFTTTTTQLKAQLGPLLATEFVKYESPLAVYKASFQKGTFLLNISLSSKGQIIGLLLSPDQEAAQISKTPIDPSLTESPVLLKTLAGTISGTLTTPQTINGKIPVVLIIAGSGPVDRDGNSAKLSLATNDYKMMAEALGKSGIASLRYDKRMVGESATKEKEESLRFDDYVDDAIGMINLLKEDKRFSKVIILGHSEGSLVGMLAAQATEGSANAFISVAGAGRRADDILKEQMKSQPEYIADGFKRIMDSLAKGSVQKKVDPSLYFIARPSIQNYLMSWCKFDPQQEIKRLRIPILIIQGNTDLQVPVTDADKLKKAKSSATLTIIHDMNHVLKDAPADKDKNMATYNQPELPLKPEFVTSVLDFIKGLK
jgi:pimeloyl-ACP methyl ester carboxylesterase